jgi:hypothetical protein
MIPNLNKTLTFGAALLFAIPLSMAAEKSSSIKLGNSDQQIKRGDIEVLTRVSGLATALDIYDIKAPFNGRVENMMVELFDRVEEDGVMARLASTEMAALLDASSDKSRKQTEERWKGVFDYYLVKPAFQGIVTGIYVEPKARVSKGDILFSVARKVTIVGKNTEKLYANPVPGMTAELAYGKDAAVKLHATLGNSTRLSPYFSRLWLEVDALRSGIRIGERFDGYLYVGKSTDTLLVPRTALIEKFGRKYLIMEVETGISNEAQTEILKPGQHFISPR